MFRIGEFSRLTQVSVRMLRYYNEVGLLIPTEIDSWTGYRLYSVDQILTLNKIVYLRDSGFSVSEMAKIINSDDVFLIEKLNEKYSEIQKNIELEEERLEKIMIAKKALIYKKNEMHYNVSIKSIPSDYVLSLRRVVPNYYCESNLWEELLTFAKKEKIDVSSHAFSIYHDEEYKENNVDIELCVPIRKHEKIDVINDDLAKNIEGDFEEELFANSNNCGEIDHFMFYNTNAVQYMACTMVYGEFSNIAGAYLALAKWLQKSSQYKINGPTRQIIHRGPWNEECPHQYLTELQIPLEKMNSKIMRN